MGARARGEVVREESGGGQSNKRVRCSSRAERPCWCGCCLGPRRARGRLPGCAHAALPGRVSRRAAPPAAPLPPNTRAGTHRLKATMPPKAEMGSAMTARRYASSRSPREATPQGLVCFTITQVGSAKSQAALGAGGAWVGWVEGRGGLAVGSWQGLVGRQALSSLSQSPGQAPTRELPPAQRPPLPCRRMGAKHWHYTGTTVTHPWSRRRRHPGSCCTTSPCRAAARWWPRRPGRALRGKRGGARGITSGLRLHR